MAPIEIKSAGGGPGLIARTVVMDGDVPWPRSDEDFAVEWGRLRKRLAGMTAGPPRPASELTRVERYVLGVRAAARWTLGDTAAAPLSRAERPVTGESIRSELDAAESVLRARAPGWEYATGGLHWLLWATGVNDEIPYPGT